MDDDHQQETFTPTGGRAFGALAVGIGVVGVVVGLVGGSSVTWWLVALGALFAALAWSALLRPRVSVTPETLVLRNMLDTVRIPMAGVEEVAVRQVLAVRVGERRFTSPAVGRSRRQLRRDGRGVRPDHAEDVAALAEASYGLFVEERIRSLAHDARDRRGLRAYSAEQGALLGEVRREWAVPEIAALATAVLGLAVAVALAV